MLAPLNTGHGEIWAKLVPRAAKMNAVRPPGEFRPLSRGRIQNHGRCGPNERRSGADRRAGLSLGHEARIRACLGGCSGDAVVGDLIGRPLVYAPPEQLPQLHRGDCPGRLGVVVSDPGRQAAAQCRRVISGFLRLALPVGFRGRRRSKCVGRRQARASQLSAAWSGLSGAED